MICMDFESVRRIVEKYRPSGIMNMEGSLKVLDYCQDIGCEKCELRKHYSKCPIVVSI